jgi:hypothetical protein
VLLVQAAHGLVVRHQLADLLGHLQGGGSVGGVKGLRRGCPGMDKKIHV